MSRRRSGVASKLAHRMPALEHLEALDALLSAAALSPAAFPTADNFHAHRSLDSAVALRRPVYAPNDSLVARNAQPPQ